jgi:DNA-directed RNA polymerase subunit RPC12/RpoP
MKVVCDNCGAMYKIPDDKLVKPVNKATCRQCGHRMLIPRPRQGADPDERTLVTAVPPTPAPPPMRDEGGAPTTPLHVDSEEKTLPTGGRAPEETKWIRNELVGTGAASAAARAPDRGADRAAATERLPAHGGPPSVPTPRPAARPALDEIDLSAEIETEDEDDVAPPPPAPKKAAKAKTPAPAPAPEARAAAPAHDPRGDMGLALFGVLVAGLGVTILAIAAVLDEGFGRYWIVLGSAALGTVLAAGGLTGAFFVVTTSGRGRKPAWRVVSVILGVLVGLVAGAVPAGVRVGLDSANALTDQVGAMLASATPDAPPSLADLPPPAEPDPVDAPPPADAPPADAPATDAPPADTTDTGAPAGTPDAPADTPPPTASTSGTSTPRTTTTTSTARSTSSDTSASSTPRTTTRVIAVDPASSDTRTGSRTAPPPDEKELPDDLDLGSSSRSTAASSNLPEKPPMQAIDVMVKTNVNVKRCFFEYQKAEGKLPSRIDVPFTIKPSGDATDITIKQKTLNGSPLEACLIKAIRGITFPPSQQGTSLTFPFVFQ